jgi:phosphoheptose isomerase
MTKKYNELLNILIEMYLNKNKLFVAGNGGSAADC